MRRLTELECQKEFGIRRICFVLETADEKQEDYVEEAKAVGGIIIPFVERRKPGAQDWELDIWMIRGLSGLSNLLAKGITSEHRLLINRILEKLAELVVMEREVRYTGDRVSYCLNCMLEMISGMERVNNKCLPVIREIVDNLKKLV